MHYDKLVEPAENIVLGSSTLKWHNLAKADEPVPDEVFALAHSFLKDNVATDELGELGFVILHRCGDDFYFLLVNTWKNENELWESVYAKTSADDANFSLVPIAHPHHATFCVWELAAVWHEQQAWRKFLLSEGTQADKTNYLKDQHRGVGDNWMSAK